MTDQTILLNLAPTELLNYREARYDGGGFDIRLTELAPEDIALMLRTYQSVKGLYDLWLYMRDTPNYPLLRQQIKSVINHDFITTAQALGAASNTTHKPSANMRKAIHDIRGGALTSLIGYVPLMKMFPENDEFARKAVFLARDHAKMMRNIVPDIDIAVRAADESMKLHRIDDFIDKWADFSFEVNDKRVSVRAESSFDGFITNRCLETSAIDRILYNYINNAARFSVSDTIDFIVLPIGQDLTRWVIANDINPDQAAWLAENLPQGLGDLFRGGYTRGGHGIGLSSCTDLVAASFGVEAEEAISGQYLGAQVVDGRYYGWFHWPAYIPEHENEPVCECED